MLLLGLVIPAYLNIWNLACNKIHGEKKKQMATISYFNVFPCYWKWLINRNSNEIYNWLQAAIFSLISFKNTQAIKGWLFFHIYLFSLWNFKCLHKHFNTLSLWISYPRAVKVFGIFLWVLLIFYGWIIILPNKVYII